MTNDYIVDISDNRAPAKTWHLSIIVMLYLYQTCLQCIV